MHFVVVRVACVNCGNESVTVSMKGKENDIKCYQCSSDVEVMNELAEIGPHIHKT